MEGDERYDRLLGTISCQVDGIEALMDTFFGFLLRKTDFFTSAPNSAECEKMVLKSFRKAQSLVAKVNEEKQAMNKKADEERSRRLQAERKQAVSEFEKQQEYLKRQPKVQDVTEEEEEKKEIINNTSKKQPTTAAASTATANISSNAPKQNTEKADQNADSDDNDGNDSAENSPNAGNGGSTDKYSWTQTLSTVEVQIAVPPGTKSRDCEVVMTPGKLKVALKGKTPLIDGEFHAKIKSDDSFWTLMDNKTIVLTIEKVDGMRWWNCIVAGDPEIDTKKIVPENSKLSDLDPETRTTVEKMMYDQRQKNAGLPTSDQQQQAALLEKFKAAHPEMDFSNAKINWGGNSSGMFNNFS